MDASSSSGTGEQGRQKRVLPSRSRRGGPGVGGCDIDIMILDAQKWKYTDHLIPADTPFLLTTKSDLAQSSSDSQRVVKTVVNERYFNRPEVIKAYREQTNIQTPAFINISDVPSVGGRFRPREADQAVVDTSDAEYEKRHKKYEAFEKRQRYREKEKLQHEHYKLKERIEQLRAMDGAAFLTLPASSFSPVSGIPAGVGDDDNRSISGLPGAHINGATAYNEGERRRKEMLETANFLDERYRTLLPPERVRKSRPNDLVGNSAFDGDEISEGMTTSLATHKETERLKFKLPARSTTSTPSAPSPSYSKPHQTSTSTKKSRLSAPPNKLPGARTRKDSVIPLQNSGRRQTSASPPPSTTQQLPLPQTGGITGENTPEIDVEGNEPELNHSRNSSPSHPVSSVPSRGVAHIPNNAEANYNIAALGARDANVTSPAEELESISTIRPKKRVKQSNISTRGPSLPPITTISASNAQWSAHPSVTQSSTKKSHVGTSYRSEKNKCTIVQVAEHNVSTRNKAPRHVKAFGVKLPAVLSDQRDFELPPWILDAYQHPSVVHGPDTMAGRSPDGSGHSDDEELEQVGTTALEARNLPQNEAVTDVMQGD